MEKRIGIVFVLVGILFATQAIGGEVLKLAILDFPPYEFKDSDNIEGISVRIVREVFRRMNQPISIELYPWPRALMYLKQGKIDGLFEVLKNAEREEFADYSQVVLMYESASLFVLKDSSIAFDGDLSKLKGFTFGKRHGFSYGQKFDQAIKKEVISTITEEVEMENLLRMLNAGRIDILIGDKYGTPYLYNKMKASKKHKAVNVFKKIKRLSPDVESTPAYMVFSKKNRLGKIRDRFDNILLEIKSDGTYGNILNTWETLDKLEARPSDHRGGRTKD
jgi:polar amino acid transport system substrate-binding protein